MAEQNIKFFDSHAHYYDARFCGEENPLGVDSLLCELFENSVCGIINVGTNPRTNRAVIEQAQKYSNMYAAVGIQPEDLKNFDMSADELLADVLSLAADKQTARKNKIVAIGEIGLDYYWQPYDKELQMYAFSKQLELARELELPVIIHDREAHADCLDTVLKYPEVKGVFHSYSGSAEMAKELVRHGWYISFSGVVSFKNGRRAKEAARVVPDDMLLIETDAPYLTPHPFRGQLNHSGRLLYTATAIAEQRECSVEKIATLSAENAKRLFGLNRK